MKDETRRVLLALLEFVERCTYCDGGGEHPRYEGEACPDCGGTGEVFGPGVDSLIKEIRTAISKAEGRS
jgi:DnaJ-class molecular chaperone